jgi:hypothetical protein
MPPEHVRLQPERKPVKLDRHWTDRVTVTGVLRDGFSRVVEAVAKPVRTAASLISRPGRVIRSYLQGDRDGITGPIWMAILGVSLFLIVNETLASDLSAFFDPLVWFRDFWAYFAPLLLLPISALQKRIFRRRDVTFGDTYVFGLYMLGQIAIFRTVILLLRHATGIGVFHSSTGDMLLTTAVMAAEAAYVAWSATGFYRDRRPSVWLRGALVYGSFAALGYGVLYGIVTYVFRGLFS